jgi:hypothetical protein
MKKEKGKKKRDILSMYNAIFRPWQKVAYCGIVGTDLTGLRPLGVKSCKQMNESKLVDI